MNRNPYLTFFTPVTSFVIVAGSSFAQSKDCPTTAVPFTEKMTDNKADLLNGITGIKREAVSVKKGTIQPTKIVQSDNRSWQFRIVRELIVERCLIWLLQRITAIETLSK